MDKNTLLQRFFVVVGLGASLAVGMTQGALFFADFGAGETIYTRTLLSVGIAIVSGSILGYIFQRFWWLSIVAIWMPILFTVVSVAHMLSGNSDAEGGLFFVLRLVPILVILVAARIGYQARSTKDRKMTLLVVVSGIVIGLVSVLISS